MYFRLEDSYNLWTAYHRTRRMVPRQFSNNEMALETDGDIVYVYRDNAFGYCESSVEAAVKEGGHIVVEDISPLEFTSGPADFRVENDESLLVTGEKFDMKLRLLPDQRLFYARNKLPANFQLLPSQARKVTWASGRDNTGLEFVWIDSHRLTCADSVIISFYRNPDLFLEGEVAISTRNFSAAAGDKIAFEKDKVWFQGADYTMYVMTENVPNKPGMMINKAMELREKSAPSCRFKADKYELLDGLKMVRALGYRINDIELAVMKVNDGISLEGWDRQGRSGNYDIEAECEGQMDITIRPAQIISAIDTIEEDEVEVVQMTDEHGNHFLVVEDERITNFIPQIADKWRS